MLVNLARETPHVIRAMQRPQLKLVGSSVRPKLWEQMPVDIRSGGVTVHMDGKAETYYIDTAPDHSPQALRTLLGALPTYGLEPMPDWEYPAETLDDGTIRVWLAEVSE